VSRTEVLQAVRPSMRSACSLLSLQVPSFLIRRGSENGTFAALSHRRWDGEWAADGKGLFVARHVQDGTDLLHVDLKGKISPLWKSNGPRCSGTPSPDGRHLAIYDWKRGANMWMMENF
jgi:hypothetical protein